MDSAQELMERMRVELEKAQEDFESSKDVRPVLMVTSIEVAKSFEGYTSLPIVVMEDSPWNELLEKEKERDERDLAESFIGSSRESINAISKLSEEIRRYEPTINHRRKRKRRSKGHNRAGQYQGKGS